MKDWLSRCNQNKRKTVALRITHLMWSLVLLLTIFLWLVESCSWLVSKYLPSLPLSSLTLHFHALDLQSYRNHVKEISGSFKDPARVDLTVLKKIVNFWRFQNDSTNLLGMTKRGKLVSYFLNNDAKTFLYRLKISENIETGHSFQSIAVFHLSSNLHTSCLITFNWKLWFRKNKCIT